MDTVAAGFRADVDDRITDAGSRSEEDLIFGEDTQGECVDEIVSVVARLEDALAADGRHTKTVAVVRDAADDSADDVAIAVAGFGVIERPEAERIHHGQRARAHRENVAKDAAYACRRALEGLDKARVIVGLDLERGGVSVADVDDPGVLTRPDENPVAVGGQFLEVLT